MRICLVTSFPPSHERLNEYGYHLARQLQQEPLLSLTVLADEFEAAASDNPDFDVIRCWKPNSFSNASRILRTVRELRPDIVWFNSVFSSFGTRPGPAFAGLCAPALARAAGYSTHITLHHLMESIDLKDAGIKRPFLYNIGGSLATRLLLLADSVTVLLPAYRRTLINKYRGKNVHLRAHGVFAGTPHYPDFSRRDNPEQRILAFGKWGTYKRLEILIEAFSRITHELPNARLVIAGENHPSTPGYVESIAQRVKDNPQVTVRGYVREADLPELFGTASVVVMPYSSSTGSSGVAHQACQFGVPIVCADVPEFHDMAAEEQIAMEYYNRGAVSSLSDKLIELLEDNQRRRAMAEQNFHAAMRMTMPQVVRQYLRAFHWHCAARTTGASRFRRIRPATPAWAQITGALFTAPPPAPLAPSTAAEPDALALVPESAGLDVAEAASPPATDSTLLPELFTSTTPGKISQRSVGSGHSHRAPSAGKRRSRTAPEREVA
jgi:glycosyltransferase involved in cell wall biosynthesis